MKPAHNHEPATYEDVKALPPNLVGELIAGELFASPRPAFGHAHTTSTLGMRLGNPFQLGEGGPGGWLIVDEPELHLAQDIFVPDLAGWRRERMLPLPAVTEPFLTLTPDWICEVLSPSTARLDQVLKKRRYAEEGVAHLWLVDPVARTLQVYKLGSGHWIDLGAFSDDDTVRAEPFDAVELKLALLWG